MYKLSACKELTLFSLLLIALYTIIHTCVRAIVAVLSRNLTLHVVLETVNVSGNYVRSWKQTERLDTLEADCSHCVWYVTCCIVLEYTSAWHSEGNLAF